MFYNFTGSHVDPSTKETHCLNMDINPAQVAQKNGLSGKLRLIDFGLYDKLGKMEEMYTVKLHMCSCLVA